MEKFNSKIFNNLLVEEEICSLLLKLFPKKTHIAVSIKITNQNDKNYLLFPKKNKKIKFFINNLLKEKKINTLIRKVIKTKRYIILKNISESFSGYSKFYYHSLLILPVVFNKEVIATVNILSEKDKFFNDKNINQLSKFLEKNSPLFLLLYQSKTLSNIRQEINFRCKVQHIFNNILFQSPKLKNLEKSGDYILEQLVSLPLNKKISSCALFILRDSPGILSMISQKGLPKEIINSCQKVHYSQCLCGKAAIKKEILFVPAGEKRSILCKNYSTCYVPLWYSQKFLGLLVIFLPEEYVVISKYKKLLQNFSVISSSLIYQKLIEK